MLVQSYAGVEFVSISHDDGILHYTKYYVSKCYPITGLDSPLGLQQVEAPMISRQSVHEGGKVINRYPWYTLLSETESTPGHRAARKIKSTKNPSNTIRIQTQDRPACSTVPQPNVPIYTHIMFVVNILLRSKILVQAQGITNSINDICFNQFQLEVLHSLFLS
jgi:hypothetical protein